MFLFDLAVFLILALDDKGLECNILKYKKLKIQLSYNGECEETIFGLEKLLLDKLNLICQILMSLMLLQQCKKQKHKLKELVQLQNKTCIIHRYFE